jgi:hypothetical protein
MADLTAAQLAYLRSEVSEEVADDADLAARYERLGNLRDVALEVVRGRLAEVMGGPGAYNVTGVYSEDNTSLIRGLTAQLTRIKTTQVDPTDGSAEAEGMGDLVRMRLRGRRSR